MKAEIIDNKIVELRRNLADILIKLEDLAKNLRLEKELEILRDTFARLNAPFLFVVVGEVKSGKSSFVNALLGEHICKVAPTICTDRVQEITFGEQEYDERIGKHLQRITRPIEFLKSIAIVDTPGTGAIIEDHQIITESYIPHADLVIFVFQAKVPYTKSAWDLLSFVKDEWKRKVIFVLQQADLEPEHIAVQKESVVSFALQKGVRSPLIFATSAMWELNGKSDLSGFGAVRDYIRSKITGGTHLYEKLDGQIRTVSSTREAVKRLLDGADSQLQRDQAIQHRIQSRLDCGKGRASKEINALVERLVTKYESIANQFKRKFRDGLEIGKVFRRVLPGSESTKKWFEGLQKEFRETLSAKAEEISKEQAELFIGDVKSLIRDLLSDLEKITRPQDSFDAAGQMEKRRADVINDVKTKLGGLSQNIDELLVLCLTNDWRYRFLSIV